MSLYTDVEKSTFLQHDLSRFILKMPLLTNIEGNGESLDDAINAYLDNLKQRSSQDPDNTLLYTLFSYDLNSLVLHLRNTWLDFYDYIILPVLRKNELQEMVKTFITKNDSDLAYYRKMDVRFDGLLHQHLRISNNW